MSRTSRHLLSLAVGVATLGLLASLTRGVLMSADAFKTWAVFAALATIALTVGVPLGGGEVSLLPMTIVSAVLVMGPVPAAWAVYVGALVRGVVRQCSAPQLGVPREPDLLSLAAVSTANATMHAVSILAAGQVYLRLGGVWPLGSAELRPVAVLALAGSYLGINFALAGLFIRFLKRAPLTVYLRSLPRVIAFEATPLVFSPSVALTYTHLGPVHVSLAGLALMAVSLILRGLVYSRQRLERRVRELDSLRAVGEALSTSLELDAVLEAVYEQVSTLMPAHSFYIALHDPDVDQIRFPLAIVDGRRVTVQPRRPRNGVTEYILRHGEPLLMAQDVNQCLQRLGLETIGPPAASWVGVPIVSNGATVGVIGLQSRDTAGVYDHDHQRILVAIASQAGAAIQRARLYQRTDDALERRVQELDSILYTTQEGILLLDGERQVVMANPAAGRLLGLDMRELEGTALGMGQADGVLLDRLGYGVGELEAECAALDANGVAGTRTALVDRPESRHMTRTLAPVRGQGYAVKGWLLLLRDVTEEVELNQFRDDMTRMLVHDLRSPLAVLRGSLDLIDGDIANGDLEGVVRWVDAARSGSERMLRLIDQLLDLGRLESGRLPTNLEAVDASLLLEETVQRFATLAREAEIRLQIVTEPGVPALYVDRGLIGRVLANLVDNALKFTDNGGVVRIWAREDSRSSKREVLVGVSDTGPGIDEVAQATLFEKFNQASGTEGRRRGTGLGLAFCKLAVGALNGEISVESPSDVIGTGHPGGGTTFVMRLPAAGEPVSSS